MVIRAIICLLLLAVGATGSSLAADVLHTELLHPSFATLQVEIDGHPERMPVLTGEAGENLVIKFDELGDSRRNLRFSLQHCTADWKPTPGLLPSEFASGWNEGEVPQGEFSRATMTHYVHYELRVPGDGVAPLLLGNYILTVYEEGSTPETPLLRARFGVTDHEISLSATYSGKTDIDYLASHQQLEITADIQNARIQNPYTDILLVIDQNSRPDTERRIQTPASVNGTRAIYRHGADLIFPAGNEYRRIETVSTEFHGMGIESTGHDYEGYHAVVRTDEPRSEAGYSYDETQYGRFTIREYNSDRSDIDADYVETHFTLAMPRLQGAEVYVEGDLSGRRLDESSRMVYDDESQAYRWSAFLKQGAYNYQYVALPGTNTLTVEGNYHQTRNRYNIRVYYRRPGERFDRLAGILTLEP